MREILGYVISFTYLNYKVNEDKKIRHPFTNRDIYYKFRCCSSVPSFRLSLERIF